MWYNLHCFIGTVLSCLAIMALRRAVLLTRHPTKGVCPERPSGVRDLSSPPGSVHPTQLPSYQQIALICLKQHPFPSITYKRPICNHFVFNSIRTARGVYPPFLFPLFTTPRPLLTLPPVPLRANALGATMSQGARNLHDPGKQLRSPRCLRIVSGHWVRQAPRAVPG